MSCTGTTHSFDYKYKEFRYGSSLKSTGATHSFDYKYKEFLEQECHEKIIVSYFTDIEGDKFYLDRYVDNSKILKWTLTKHHEEQEHELDYPFPYDRRIDFSNTNSMLVFGGDVWDKVKKKGHRRTVC